MVRRTLHPSRAQLFVTQLEAREVPAGMIDVFDQGSYLEIRGDNNDNHLRVEYIRAEDVPVGYQVRVSSETGPIRYVNASSGESFITDAPIVLPAHLGGGELYIETGNGDDRIDVLGTARPNANAYMEWGYISIASGNGDDRVLLDDVLAPLSVSTGNGADLVTLRNCSGHIFDSVFSNADIETGAGNDRVVLRGTFNYASNLIRLGAGDDVLEGDAEATLPPNIVVFVDGGDGFDRVMHADYFRVQWPFSGIEEIS